MSTPDVDAGREPQQPGATASAAALLVFMLVVGLYFVGRVGGYWAEADSTTFTRMIRPIAQTGHLLSVEARGNVYPNGYAFQSVSVVLMGLTGLDVLTLQQLVYPLLASLVVLPAWICYRELCGGARAATIATVLLFTQPEFLFVVLRSSHEKFTRTWMLLSLFLLARSLRYRDRPLQLAIHVVLYYLVSYALIASNNLLAHSFVAAILSALLLGLALRGLVSPPHRDAAVLLKRLSYVVLISVCMVYVFTFFLYPPAMHDLEVMRDVWNRIGALMLDIQTTGGENTTNAYAAVTTGWVSLPVYLLVSIANWIVLAASFLIWLRRGIGWLRSGMPPARERWLLWLLYTAFIVQGALSIVADASGALSANLQHRLYPSFSLVAVAMVATSLAAWRPRSAATPLRVVLAAAAFVVAILSVFKATNEPLLSNKWTFYRPAEIAALDWSANFLRNAEIWTEFDERLAVAYDGVRSSPANGNRFVGYVSHMTRNLIATEVNRLRSVRYGVPVPIPPGSHRVYDNGQAELYHLRPSTPNQR